MGNVFELVGMTRGDLTNHPKQDNRTICCGEMEKLLCFENCFEGHFAQKAKDTIAFFIATVANYQYYWGQVFGKKMNSNEMFL